MRIFKMPAFAVKPFCGSPFGLLPSCLLSFCALTFQVSAATVDLEFTGILNLNEGSTTNFFSAKNGESVNGRFRFDTAVPQRNISSTPDITIHYNPGAVPTRELKFIESEFEGLSFDFTRAPESGLDRDNFRLGPFGTNQSLAFTDLYSSSTGGTCGGSGSADLCWGIQFGVLLPPGFLEVKWPQPVSLGTSELIGDEIRFVLYNERGDYGPTGLSTGYLSLTGVNMAPAPVPLPGSSWLLLTALGVLGWLKRQR